MLCCTCCAVCELYERPDAALRFAAAVMDEPSKGGCGMLNCGTRTLALCMQGRAQAALGQVTDAATSIECAVAEARRSQLPMLELLARRDLQSCVLDASGHGEHGARCLGSTLRRMAGPIESFSLILGEVDVHELVGLPEPTQPTQPPSAKPRIREESATLSPSTPPSTAGAPEPVVTREQRRMQLNGLRLGALSKRARMVGVHEGVIEEAVDEGDKATLIAQIIATESPGTVDDARMTAEEQLRLQLNTLKLGALSRRASLAGVDEDTIESAVDDGDKATLIAHIVAVELSGVA